MNSDIAATIKLKDASAAIWDVLIVGAGPAGALLAWQLACNKVKVLLVDKSAFPRTKVCGCCLNGASIRVLEQCGLAYLLESAVPLQKLQLHSGGLSAAIKIDGKSISRECFDSSLVKAGIEAGAHFLPSTTAFVGDTGQAVRCVYLQDSRTQPGFRPEDTVATARVVVVADGLGGRSLERLPAFVVNQASNSRIGAGTVIGAADSSYAAGTIYMACGQGGYVGLVRLEDHRLDVACAFDPDFTRAFGNLGLAAGQILQSCQLPAIAELVGAQWRGTCSLSRQRLQLCSPRLFVIGDAAGYAEPFTGEGMAWSMKSAIAVSPLVQEVLQQGWNPEMSKRWTDLHRKLFGKRQSISRGVGRLLRQQSLAQIATNALARMPILASPLLAYINSG